MDKKAILELCEISHSLGNNKKYVQGGGGNISVKLSDEIMAIKASGTFLSEMTETYGFVALNYKVIADYHNAENKVFEGDPNEIVGKLGLDNIVNVNGEPKMRPSVELGFHAILKKYVVHTHSVFTNVYLCSQGGAVRLKGLLEAKGIGTVVIESIDPGFFLTEKIRTSMKDDTKVILLENHGVVVHSDLFDEVLSLHEEINQIARDGFGVQIDFPIAKVEEKGDACISKTDFSMLKTTTLDMVFAVSLYPDQLVYTKNTEKVKLIDGAYFYNTNLKESTAIDETICGVLFVLEMISQNGWSLQEMPKEKIDYINNWESEKYRVEMLKK